MPFPRALACGVERELQLFFFVEQVDLLVLSGASAQVQYGKQQGAAGEGGQHGQDKQKWRAEGAVMKQQCTAREQYADGYKKNSAGAGREIRFHGAILASVGDITNFISIEAIRTP